MAWIFKCDRCGQKSISEEGILRRDGEHAATVTIKLAKATEDDRPEHSEICKACHSNLYVWFDNLDVVIPRHSNTPPPTSEVTPHGPT